MRNHSDLDTMYLVPAPVADILEAFSSSPVPGVAYAIEQHEDQVTVRDGGMVVAEVYMTILGGCVVRTAPIMGDAAEMASFVSDPNEAERIIAAEEAACRAEELVLQIGGIPGHRRANKWVPVLERDRAGWSAHVVAENTRRMRLMGVERRGAKGMARLSANDIKRQKAA